MTPLSDLPSLTTAQMVEVDRLMIEEWHIMTVVYAGQPTGCSWATPLAVLVRPLDQEYGLFYYCLQALGSHVWVEFLVEIGGSLFQREYGLFVFLILNGGYVLRLLGGILRGFKCNAFTTIVHWLSKIIIPAQICYGKLYHTEATCLQGDSVQVYRRWQEWIDTEKTLLLKFVFSDNIFSSSTN